MKVSRERRVSGCLFTIATLAGTFACGSALAVPTPVYTHTFTDAVTGTNVYTDSSGKRFWTITPGADSYQNDFYERPTAQTYEVRNATGGGGQQFAAKEYFQYLDITQAKVGYDEQYLYVSIQMFGLAKSTEDGKNDIQGLVERYGFRIGNGTGASEAAGGLLLYVDNPANKSQSTTFNGNKAEGYRDVNGDVGGTGIDVSKSDVPSEVNGNGYERKIIADGKAQDISGKPLVLYSRINPNDATIVEFALDHALLNLAGLTYTDFLEGIAYLEFEAIKGGPKDPQNYLWNDEYTKNEAGSPYRATTGDTSKSEFGTQGLGNIYELDTLRGFIIPEISTPTPISSIIPEPATAALGLMVIGSMALRGRRHPR